MNVKYITIKMVNNKSWVWETIGTMGGKNFSFLYEVFKRIDVSTGYYMAGFYKVEVCEKLGISNATYWNRVNKLITLSILKSVGRGVYSLNTGWIKVLNLEEKNK